MAPGQRTFTIVPNPLGIQGLQQRPAGESVPTNHRPMTSKQAQKLHRQATKVPKMTRAEERAWEKKMQADIKEEKEKHRQSNKARMLRNKKKEREQKIIEAKKRKGLPIVDVRPSQDLITRFVKGNGTAKKRDSAGAGLDTVREESPACDSATETAADADTHGLEEEEVEDSDAKSEYLAQVPEPRQSPAKRQRTESPEARHSAGSPVASPRHFPRASTALSALRVLDHKSRESSMDVDDTAIEDMLTTQILEESISAANSSAVQQRSPVRSNGITSNQQVSQGKENTPPLSKTTITSECCVKKSPRRLAQARLSPQRNSPKADSVTSRKRPAGRSPAPSEAVKRPGLSESQISPKPPNAPHPGPKNPHQAAAAASNVGKPSRHQPDPREAAMSPAPRTCPNGTITGPVNSKIQQTETGSLTSRAPMVASQRPTAAPAPNVELQNSAGRKPLQETTLNTVQPARAVSRPYAAMRKSPPVRAAARPVHVAAKQTMPPPRQPGNRFQRPPQESNRPKFLPKHLQTPQTRPPVGRMSPSPVQGPRTILAESAPPSSTQLFLHSFIDDIMPSPSQEARELQEMTPPAPAPKARRPVWKPPPRFAARGPQVVKRAMPPPPPPPQPKAPGFRQTPTPRAPLPPLQLSQAIEPVLPFFSTQDFMLSSQDIRDLQDTTETPSKLPGKGTSRTTAIRANDKETPSKPQKPPSRPGKATVQARVNVTTQHTTIPAVTFDRPQFPQPPRYVLRISQPPTPVCTPGASGNPSQLSQPQPRANRLNPVLSNPALAHVAGPSQRRLRSSPLAQQQDVTAAQSKPLTFENYRPTTASPAPIQPSPAQLIQAVEQDPLPKRDPSPKPETPKASASPKKGRFFTASNEQVQLAMEKSLRTHKEEQRKREAEQRALKLEEERRAREQRALMQEAERKARQRRRQEEEALMEPCWDMEDLWQECETDGETDSGDPERCLSRRERQQNRFDERMNEEVARIEAREAERERSMDFYNEHAADEVESRKEDALAEARYEAELRAEELQKEESKTEVLKNGDLKGTVKEDPYDLDADFEELLGAELDLVDVKSSTSPGDVKQGTMVFMASQETDYGDMDVTLEDLDDFL